MEPCPTAGDTDTHTVSWSPADSGPWAAPPPLPHGPFPSPGPRLRQLPALLPSGLWTLCAPRLPPVPNPPSAARTRVPPWPAGSGRGNRPAPAGRGTPRPCRARAAGGWRPRRAGRTAGRNRSWPPRSRRPRPAPCRLRAGRDGAALPGRGERRARPGGKGCSGAGNRGIAVGIAVAIAEPPVSAIAACERCVFTGRAAGSPRRCRDGADAPPGAVPWAQRHAAPLPAREKRRCSAEKSHGRSHWRSTDKPCDGEGRRVGGSRGWPVLAVAVTRVAVRVPQALLECPHLISVLCPVAEQFLCNTEPWQDWPKTLFWLISHPAWWSLDLLHV